jgi:hypothetical protein
MRTPWTIIAGSESDGTEGHEASPWSTRWDYKESWTPGGSTSPMSCSRGSSICVGVRFDLVDA